jgi:release factor glutamine methyltransferase
MKTLLSADPALSAEALNQRPFWTALAGRIRCLHLPLLRQFLERRVGRLVLERVEGIPLVVLPDVFNPAIFRSSAYMVRALQDLAEPRLGNPRPAALDLGTGSGIGAIALARLGYQVTAVDVNPHAVRCAWINALMNDQAGQIDVHEGDLFDPVEDAVFDLILFNPPFFRGVPKGERDRAWRSPDVIERFARGLPRALAASGTALIIFSANGDLDGLLRALQANRLAVRCIARHDYGNEILVALEVRHI